MEVPKVYEPQSVEDKWYDFWQTQGFFTADPSRVSEKRPAYSIVIPPPNVTGMLHMGHVLNNTIQDILARKARMDGKEVLWLPGTDHAGIATEGMVSRQIWKQEKKSKRELGRKEFIQRVWTWKDKHGGIIISQLKKLGCSCDWTRERFTMDPDYVRTVQRVFVALYNKGLIYRGKRMVNWCPATQTALSDEEVEMEPQKGFLYYFKVEVDEPPGTFLTIATTRPETIPGDTAIAVNPKDSRYARLIGKYVVRPLPVQLPRENKLIPIIGDEYVDFEFGTGVLKVTPAHDKNDFEIGQRHRLPAVDIMNPDGTMNELAGETLSGLDRFEARAAAVERLKELGAMVKEEPYENKIGFSQRAKVPIEPRLSEQWFLKYPAVEQSKACVEQEDLGSAPAPGAGASALAGDSGRVQRFEVANTSARARAADEASAAAPEAGALPRMRFHPQRWAKVYNHWLTNIQDWCISRQLWWGHRIPVWYRNGEVYCGLEAPTGEGWVQDPDVLDTWFSSWLWPFATMGWRGDKTQDSNNPTLQAFYPTTDLVTGPDIIFFWVARMIMAGYEFMGAMPFRNVYFTGIIRDKQGRKMSKTLGNSPDPLDLIAKYGADALRFGTMRSAPLGQDVLFDEKDVELGRNFCNKLWNACRFRQMVAGTDEVRMKKEEGTAGTNPSTFNPQPSTFPVQGEIQRTLLTTDDKWILLKLNQAILEITEALNEYKFNEATATLYRFFWSEYCDWYVEASKAVLSRPATDSTPSPPNRERAGVRGEENQDASHESKAPPHPNPLPPASQGGEGEANRAASQSEARRANTVAVIDFVLSHTLRLFHPFLPFITEELWHGMGYAEDMPENQGGKTIMNAPWPKPFDDDFRGHYGLDDCYLEMVDAKYDLVTQGRNLRRSANIPAGKKVRFVFKPVQFITPHDTEVLRLLLNAETFEVNAEYPPPKGTPTVRTGLGELCLPLEGLIDVAAEKARLTKEKERIESEISKVEQKLANPNFAQKVPPQVLAEHRQRLADWIAKLEHVKAALRDLEGGI